MRDYTQPGWSDKGATLSDKTARKEFGLTRLEILDAVNAGKKARGGPPEDQAAQDGTGRGQQGADVAESTDGFA